MSYNNVTRIPIPLPEKPIEDHFAATKKILANSGNDDEVRRSLKNSIHIKPLAETIFIMRNHRRMLQQAMKEVDEQLDKRTKEVADKGFILRWERQMEKKERLRAGSVAKPHGVSRTPTLISSASSRRGPPLGSKKRPIVLD